jgi:hypothetical protein
MAVMSFESGFDPARVNSTSGATGLIQFLPSTAQALGTSTAQLAAMTAVEQLDWVEKYFAQPAYRGKLGTLEGTYTAVLSGQAHDNSEDVLFRRGTLAYTNNSVLDFNDDEKITAGEATHPVALRLFGGSRNVQQ